MTHVAPITQEVASSHSFLNAVKAYLDLISKDDPLTYGNGLKTLYTMSSGVGTLSDRDIKAIVEKSESLKLIPNNLTGFMKASVVKNLYLFGLELKTLIHERIIDISTGYVKNPQTTLNYNPDRSRRSFYTPPLSFIKRLERALKEDTYSNQIRLYQNERPATLTLQEVSQEGEAILVSMGMNEGVISPTPTSWGALSSCIDGLVDLLKFNADHLEEDYKSRTRPAVKILWVITKILMGDLSSTPKRHEVNVVDLNDKINLSDGTLASIPFPLKNTISIFEDTDYIGLSLKARLYLNAISAAAFYKPVFNDERM